MRLTEMRKILKAGVRQFSRIDEIHVLTRCAVQIAGTRKHRAAVVGDGGSHTVVTCLSFAIQRTINRLCLRTTGCTSSHHIVVHAITAQQVLLLPGVYLLRKIKVVVALLDLHFLAGGFVSSIYVAVGYLITFALVQLVQPYQWADH